MTAVTPLPFTRRLGPLALVTGVFFVNLSCRAVLGPLMPAVEADLGLSHGQAGVLFLLLSLGYCGGLLCAGFVNARLCHRNTIVLSSVVMGLVLLAVGATRSPDALRVGLVLLGAGAGFYLPSGVATVTSLVAPGDWGKALAFHELAPNLGFTLAPLLAEGFLRCTSWRGTLTSFGFGALAAAALFARFGTGGGGCGQAPRWSDARSLGSQRSFWILLALFSVGLAATLGVYAMMPLYLTSERGFARGTANGLVAVSRAASAVTVFASGWLTDRLGPRRAIGLALGATGVLTLLLGFAGGGWLVPVALLQPVVGAWFFPAAFAALSTLGPLAVSFSVPFAMALGGGLAPALIGRLGQHGAFGEGIGLVGLACVAGALLSLRLPVPVAESRVR